jgi:outer membrane receptor protein involved in Fe transport
LAKRVLAYSKKSVLHCNKTGFFAGRAGKLLVAILALLMRRRTFGAHVYFTKTLWRANTAPQAGASLIGARKIGPVREGRKKGLSMKVSKGLVSVTGRLLCGAAVGAIAATSASAQSISDEIVVTAQRQEQSLQDVPIAVSAFSGDDLASRQLETFQDIQFNIPNFQFSRTNFTGSAVSIRGIGNFLVASSSENAVSVHMNDFFLNSPRLFETEFFDVERLEILRGPQGTLFGRNATGGVINVITKKASVDGYEGYADAEYGNYNSVKVQGALNVPLSDRLAVRIAGTTIQRDGYTQNVYNNTDIDDRNIYALRGSVRWVPTDNTTVDIITSYMREDDSRMRHQKQACEAGPLSPLLGCDPNGPRRFDAQDGRATFLVDNSAQSLGAVFGPSAAAFGLYSLANGQFGAPQPQDLRQVAWDTQPKYDAEESIFMMNLKHDFENWSFKLNGGWGNSKIATRVDYDGGLGPQYAVPAALAALPGVNALYADGNFPLSSFDVGVTNSNGNVGVIGGHIFDRSNRYRAVDLSIGETDYWSAEGIINTDFDSAVNFLVGFSHLESNGFADYGVATTGLDYFSLVGGTLTAAAGAAAAASAAVLGGGGTAMQAAAAAAAAQAAAVTQGYSFYKPYFYNDTDDNFLHSTSAFGEIYIDISDQLKFTGGIRHNWDTKGLRDRGGLLDSFVALATGTLPAGVTPVVPLGTPSVRGLLDSDEFTQNTPGAVNDFRVVEAPFNATTGRAVLQWTPNDNAQVYVSWTRGYKAGGFNPRAATAVNLSPTFAPEVINSYEAGIKTNLGSTLQANITGFYYDYSGLQVSRIANNTSFNENIDAKIYGVEGEFVWRPTDRFTANMNASYLHTKIGAFSTVDVRNPTAGRTDVELIADIVLGQNCVITRGATDGPLLLANGGTPLPGGAANPLNALIASPFSVCSQIAGNIATINALSGGTYGVVGGIEQSQEGNRLLGSPEFKIAGGVQYEMPFGANHVLTPRVDAYYQSDFYSNNFNTQQDLIDGYAYLNAQITFAPTDGNWSMRFFMQNLTNSDALTGAYDSGETSGNFQNLYLLEPRRWGVGINMTF